MTTKLFCTALALFALSTVACGGAVEDEIPTASEQKGATTQGLTLTKQTADRVEGTFSRHERTIGFELSTIEGGHLARILDEAGQPLVETTFKDGIEDSTLLGGQLHMWGPVNSMEPEREGDEQAFQRLSEMPIARIIPELKEALESAGVDTAFFSAKESGGQPGVTTQKWLDVWGNWHLSCGEYHDFPTWTFWGVTTFELRPEWSTATASLRVLTPWYNPTEYTGWFSGTIRLQRQYAGYNARVGNNAVRLNGQCNHPLLARTY